MHGFDHECSPHRFFVIALTSAPNSIVLRDNENETIKFHARSIT